MDHAATIFLDGDVIVRGVCEATILNPVASGGSPCICFSRSERIIRYKTLPFEPDVHHVQLQAACKLYAAYILLIGIEM